MRNSKFGYVVSGTAESFGIELRRKLFFNLSTITIGDSLRKFWKVKFGILFTAFSKSFEMLKVGLTFDCPLNVMYLICPTRMNKLPERCKRWRKLVLENQNLDNEKLKTVRNPVYIIAISRPFFYGGTQRDALWGNFRKYHKNCRKFEKSEKNWKISSCHVNKEFQYLGQNYRITNSDPFFLNCYRLLHTSDS